MPCSLAPAQIISTASITKYLFLPNDENLLLAPPSSRVVIFLMEKNNAAFISGTITIINGRINQ